MIFIRNRVINILSLCMVAACMAAIFWFSAQPSAQSSQMSGGITEEVIAAFLPGYHSWSADVQENVYNIVETVIRKSGHFLIYALLGALCMFSASRFLKKRWQQLTVSLGVCVLYAVSDELHQLFVPGRSCEFRDVFIDTGGAVLGILFMWAVLAVARRVYDRKKSLIWR